MKDCATLTNDVLMDLTEQRLGEEEREGVLAHLLDCAACRRRFEEIRSIAGAIRACAEAPPESLLRQLDAEVLSLPASRRSRRWIAALLSAAALLIVGVFGMLQWNAPEPPPPPFASSPPLFLGEPVPREPSRAAETTPGPKLSVEEATEPVAKVIVRVQGDLDGDGVASASDEDLLVRSLTSCSFSPLDGADLRPDGVFDVADRLMLKRLRHVRTPRLPGDLNGDGVADVADRQILARYLATGLDSPEPEVADLNADGSIDVADLRMLTREIARIH